MKRTNQILLGLLLAAGMAIPAAAQKKPGPRKALEVDFDMNHIAEPKAAKDSQYYDFFDQAIFEQVQQAFDLPRYFGKKAAPNVNAIEEVPDSSWFTNRNGRRRMSLEEVHRGANVGDGPSTSGTWTIIGRKPSGIAPGFRIRDSRGDVYFVKFDPTEWNELATGAEVVATKLYYASGYNTPEVYIAHIRPEQLVLGEKARIVDSRGIERPMTRLDLETILAAVPRLPGGSMRAIAKKHLPGKAKGPFQFYGTRKDDPNDWIPHEHRRDLRGLRVVASWLNDNDVRERNTLDMYVTENGRSFLRHYLIDAGSAFGSETLFPDPSHVGHEYILDWGEFGKATPALGAYNPWWWSNQAKVLYPSIGPFTADRFEPERWKQNYPLVAFENMSVADGYWGAKIVMSFTDEQIRAAVASGKYSDPRAAEFLLKVLIDRRDRIGRYWYRRAGALDNFRVTAAASGSALGFDDLVITNNFAEPAERAYRYRAHGPGRRGKAWQEMRGGDQAAIALPVVVGDTQELAMELQARNAGEAWSPAIVVFLERSGGDWRVRGWTRAQG